MAEWFNNERFWEITFPFMFPSEKLQSGKEEVQKILKLAHFWNAPVLDLCCGPGRHAMALAERGLTVTGVDRSQFLLNKAIDRAKKKGVAIDFVHEDMRHFVRNNTFSLALSLFTSFGFFANRDDESRVLKNVLDSLLPSGVLVIDVLGKENLAKIFQETVGSTSRDGAKLFQEHEILDDWTRIQNTWTVIRRNHVETFEFNLNIYSGLELKTMMIRAGFDHITLYGDLDGSPYDQEASRLIAVGRKPKRH